MKNENSEAGGTKEGDPAGPRDLWITEDTKTGQLMQTSWTEPSDWLSRNPAFRVTHYIPAPKAQAGSTGAGLDLEPIEARLNAADAGPWEALNGPAPHGAGIKFKIGGPRWLGYQGYGIPAMELAEFIAHARTDIPDLLAEVRRLRAALGSQDQGTT